jgi:ArsR family transcriptional regulator
MEVDSHKLAADLFGMLAHPQRLRILDELRRAPACVCHLQTVLDRPQAYVSQQLRVLREAQVVGAERDGLNVYYHLSQPQVVEVLAQVLGPGGEPTRLPDCPCPYCQSVYEGKPSVERYVAA